MTMNRITLILTAGALTLLATAISPAKAADPEPGGPATIQIDRLVDLYGPVTFDHAKHAASYADGCGDCHHQHSGYDKNPCKRCHSIDAAQFKAAVTRNFGACGKCHGDYDSAALDTPSLKVAYHEVCFSCHRETGDVGKTPASCEQLCHAKK
jgi:predicted CXXCH cytochrome family protein